MRHRRECSIFKQEARIRFLHCLYKCEVEDTVGETNLSENERQKGLELCYADLEEIIKTNRSLNLEESRIRDTIFLEMVADK